MKKFYNITFLLIYFYFFAVSWADNSRFISNEEQKQLSRARARLSKAIANPEYVEKSWIELPSAPKTRSKKVQNLSLHEAIFLALRYNPNIQTAELDRILQRYQLRLAHNEFELQYALTASGVANKSHFGGVGNTSNTSFLATPELGLKTPLGTQLSLKMDNSATLFNNYSPVLTFSLTQPLLSGFGKGINEIPLRNAEDLEDLNKLNLQQAISDQITAVIIAYRALVLSANNLKNQQRQLLDAEELFKINEKKVEAGLLEPTVNIQQEYQIESISLLVEQAKSELETAARDLLQAIGLDPSLRVAVPTDIKLRALKIPDLHSTIKRALAQNRQYLAQKLELRAAERAYKLAQNQQLWQLNAGINVQSGLISEVEGGSGIQSIYNGQNTAKALSLYLTVPLHDLPRRAELIAAKVRLEKDRITIVAIKRDLITLVTNTIFTIQSQAKRYLLAEKQVALALQAYDLEKKKQQAGIASALDVNNTQNQLIQAQIGLISAKIAYLNQIASLQSIIGSTLEAWNINLRYKG